MTMEMMDKAMWIAFGIGLLLQSWSIRIIEKEVKELKGKIYGK